MKREGTERPKNNATGSSVGKKKRILVLLLEHEELVNRDNVEESHFQGFLQTSIYFIAKIMAEAGVSGGWSSREGCYYRFVTFSSL